MDVSLAITGFGNVGQGLAAMVAQFGPVYRERFGVRLLITGAADRRGAVTDPSGLDPLDLLEAKRARGTVAGYPGGVTGLRGRDFLARAQAGVLVEASSTNFEDAEPGRTYVNEGLALGMDVVAASKGALALYYPETMDLARRQGRTVLFSAAVGAPVPSLQISEWALQSVRITAVEGILNGTTHQILTAMAGGKSYSEGVRAAQEMGIAETDPTLDVDGWDAAAKITILANAVLGANLRLHQVARQGIRGVTVRDFEDARIEGSAIKLIARAERFGDTVTATVSTQRRGKSDALGRLNGDAMGVVFHTDPLGTFAATVEPSGASGGVSTALTVLRDVLSLARDRGWSA